MWKQCSKCGKHKPLWMFYKQKSCKFGVSSYCIVCAKKLGRERYREYYIKKHGKQPGKIGRPLGHRLSQESKDKISKSKTGVPHAQETRDKISASLLKYFKNKHKLSDELLYSHPEAEEWIRQNADLLNDDEDGDHLYTYGQMERRHHKLTDFDERWMTNGESFDPETLLLMKEEVEENSQYNDYEDSLWDWD